MSYGGWLADVDTGTETMDHGWTSAEMSTRTDDGGELGDGGLYLSVVNVLRGTYLST